MKRLVAALRLATLLLPGVALAYPWMIKHEYTGCGTCHGDPSGGGVLTAYGRAQDVLLATTPYGSTWIQGQDGEPGRTADFAGAVHLPDWLMATVTYRGGPLSTTETVPATPGQPGGTFSDRRWLNMLLDARAQIKLGAFVAAASLGYGDSTLALPAAVTQNPNAYLLSRDHWAGVNLDNDQILLRAGRMNLPYGLRNIEHTSFVRSQTRTDINAAQEHGVAAFFGNEHVRTEVMAIAGNYQIAPDALRERGYSGYVEVPLTSRATVGVSSLLTEARQAVDSTLPLVRQAHGAFFRYSPHPMLALLGEADVTVRKQLGTGPYQLAGAGWLQLDIEPIQGFHIQPALEGLETFDQPGNGVSGWLTLDWFCLPHTDIRVDGIYQTFPSSVTGQGSTRALTLLAQIHVFL